MSLIQELKEDEEALERVAYLVEHHEELGVRGGYFWDKARPLLFRDYIHRSDLPCNITSVTIYLERLEEELSKLRGEVDEIL